MASETHAVEQEIARFSVENRASLLMLVRRHLPILLLRRVDEEDVLQQTVEAALKRRAYFDAHPDVPLYFKFRKVLLQTIADLERKHLQAGARDLHREVPLDDPADDGEGEDGRDLVADVTTPVSRVDREERHRLLRTAIRALSETDRQMITLRHFDGLGNAACAALLKIEPKAASIRYARALERLQIRLKEVSCFRTD